MAGESAVNAVGTAAAVGVWVVSHSALGVLPSVNGENYAANSAPEAGWYFMGMFWQSIDNYIA
jgi:hypothetical protein